MRLYEPYKKTSPVRERNPTPPGHWHIRVDSTAFPGRVKNVVTCVIYSNLSRERCELWRFTSDTF
jgi:hypothetical protein